MITPRFTLKQDAKYLIITIRAPYCNLKELEIYVEKNDFRFVCAPFYLRLSLPGNIIDNDECSGDYKQDPGIFELKYVKEVAGEHFENLELITSLLTSSSSKKAPKKGEIEVVGESTEDSEEWSIDQTVIAEDAPQFGEYCYGFAYNKKDLNFEEFASVFDVRNVGTLPLNERKLLKNDVESMDFAADHFTADYFDDGIICEILTKTPPNLDAEFTDKELDFLKDLPNREYLLNEREIEQVLLGLVDILFAYCYDKRTTDFESSCESGWTVTKLASTLSWCYTPETPSELLKSSFRRSLIYPLYRNFKLALKIHEDLNAILQKGQISIIKCLIDIYGMFNSGAEPRYILNDLYIKDYIIFIQKCPKLQLNSMIEAINAVKVTEQDLSLNLKEIILKQLKEVNAGNNILEKMAKLNITRIESDSESEDSESDSSESETETDGSTSNSDETSSESEENT